MLQIKTIFPNTRTALAGILKRENRDRPLPIAHKNKGRTGTKYRACQLSNACPPTGHHSAYIVMLQAIMHRHPIAPAHNR